MTVPLVAVQHGPDGLYVYVVKPDGTVARQPDHDRLPGRRADRRDRRGLAGGEQVVIDGQSRLQDGTHVAVRQTSPAADRTRRLESRTAA